MEFRNEDSEWFVRQMVNLFGGKTGSYDRNISLLREQKGNS